ncbi:hypothetical protein K440107A6_16070 [Lawsonibacter asaccharolyticus]
MSEVTKRIDNVLREKGISKKDFYEACDITSSAYSQWNTGKTEPRTAKLKEISNYLNIMYEWLAFGVGKKEKAPTQEGERAVSDDDIKFALFGGDGEITDAMYDEVKRFAQMVKLREEAEKEKK